MQDLQGVTALIGGGESFRYAQEDLLIKQLGNIRQSIQTVSTLRVDDVLLSLNVS